MSLLRGCVVSHLSLSLASALVPWCLSRRLPVIMVRSAAPLASRAERARGGACLQRRGGSPSPRPSQVRLKMAQTVKEAVKLVEQGHIRVGPEVVTDPAFLVTRCVLAGLGEAVAREGGWGGGRGRGERERKRERATVAKCKALPRGCTAAAALPVLVLLGAHSSINRPH